MDGSPVPAHHRGRRRRRDRRPGATAAVLRAPGAEDTSSPPSDEEPGTLAAVPPAPSRPASPGPPRHAVLYGCGDRARDEAEARRKACGPRSPLPPVLHADLPTQRAGGGDAHPRATCPSHRSPTGPPRCHAYPIGLAGAAPPVLG